MNEERTIKIGVRIGLSILLVLFCLGFFRCAFVNFVDNYELGYKFDTRTGEITVLKETGYFITPPVFVKIHTIDLRPWQVCINANKRVLNCKLVKFNPAGLETFISWHGRNDYDGESEMAGGLRDILKSYAYDGSGKNYPFLEVIRDLRPDAESATSAPAPAPVPSASDPSQAPEPPK